MGGACPPVFFCSASHMAHSMDIDLLTAFERVVREGSFSRAARTLNLSQPTISARIQALEHLLGGPLFVRGGRRPVLTERGESYLPFARRVLEVLAEGAEAARLTDEGRFGRVTLATLPSLTGGFLAAAVARFHTEHPQVALNIRTGMSDQIGGMLRDGLVKLGLVSWPFFDPELVPLVRFREPLILVAPAGHPLAGRGPVSLEAVQRDGHPFMLVRWGVSMNPVLAQIEPHGTPAIEVPLDTVKHLLRRGIGMAFLTRMLVADDLASGRLVEVTVEHLPQLVRESVLVRFARGSLPAAAAEFAAVLREEARELID